MRVIGAPGDDADQVWHRPSARAARTADPPTRREALSMLATLVAMLAVIFVLALTMGAGPVGQG